MPSFEALLVLVLAAAAAVAALGLFAALREPRGGPAGAALARGDFGAAVAAGGAGSGRRERLAAAVAARHLLDLEPAAAVLDRLLAEDPADGEVWLERGLVAAYAGDAATARAAFSRVEASRADLLEALTLHRAWLALDGGERAAALRLFEEVEAPLEGKLKTDLGPGDPAFAEWFLQAAALWRSAGRSASAAWAEAAGRNAAPGSLLPARILAAGRSGSTARGAADPADPKEPAPS